MYMYNTASIKPFWFFKEANLTNSMFNFNRVLLFVLGDQEKKKKEG